MMATSVRWHTLAVMPTTRQRRGSLIDTAAVAVDGHDLLELGEQQASFIEGETLDLRDLDIGFQQRDVPSNLAATLDTDRFHPGLDQLAFVAAVDDIGGVEEDRLHLYLPLVRAGLESIGPVGGV
jgi:hypothetical protein